MCSSKCQGAKYLCIHSIPLTYYGLYTFPFCWNSILKIKNKTVTLLINSNKRNSITYRKFCLPVIFRIQHDAGAKKTLHSLTPHSTTHTHCCIIYCMQEILLQTHKFSLSAWSLEKPTNFSRNNGNFRTSVYVCSGVILLKINNRRKSLTDETIKRLLIL